MKKTIKLTKKETRSIRMKKWGSALGTFLMRNASCIACVLAMCMMCTPAVHASGGTPLDAESMWGTVMGFLEKWVLRIGIGIMIWGLIQIGLGQRASDPAQKSDGMNSLAGGGMVAAAGALFRLIV